MENKIIKYRTPIILISVLLTLGFSLLLLKLEIDPDLRHYFPETMTSMVNTEKIEEIFGNQDMIMIIFEGDDILEAASLRRIRDVEKAAGRLEGVRRTSSLFGSNHIYSEEGVMYVEPTVLRIPRNERQKEELRKTILGNDLVYKVMVSEDFHSSALVISLEEERNEKEIFAGLESILEEYPGNEKVHFGGLPYLRISIDRDIKRDGLILIPIALALMFIFLFLVFREWRGAWLPFLVVIMSSLIGISFIPIMGWKFYIITLLVPILLIAVANDYGIHMIARYQELVRKDGATDMPSIAMECNRNLWKPILLTGITTMAGISALFAHTMIPARQMALAASAGILLAIIYSLVLLPAILSFLKVPAQQKKYQTRENRSLRRFSAFVMRKRRIIPPVSLLVTLVFAVGAAFLKVDSNEENFFPKKHEVKQAANLINSQFGGSESISVLFGGDMLDPAILERMESYRSEMEQYEAVDLTMSFSGIVREISKALNDPGDEFYDRIPPSREAVAQYMELYAMNGDPAELEQMVDFNYEHAHLMIRINDASNETVNQIIANLENKAATDPSIEAIGGNGYIRAELANKVITGTLYSLGIALVIIFIILSVIFRSAGAGFLGITPLSISVLVLFGLMGILGIHLDVATALLSSIMIGVGVDYTIHFLWRYREERKISRDKKLAVENTLNTTGRGIIFNALSVIVGFVVLIISSFTPIRLFGVLVVVSISTCLAGALVLLPALVLRFNFRFLEESQAIRTIPKKKKVLLQGLRRVAMTLLLLALTLISTSAQEARDIMKKSRNVVQVSSFEALSTLTITDAKGNERVRSNTMASMSMPDGTEKRIIKFLSPAEVKGTGILIFDYPEKSDDMWIYLPALRKTRRIVSREKSKSFMGSEFSNANMTAPGLEDFHYKVLGEEIIDGRACYMVESLPLDEDLEDQYGYSRSVSWVDKNNYLVHRTRYYDVDGELFKTITHLDFKDMGQGKFMVSHMEAVNHMNGRSSSMVMDRIALSAANENYFTVAYLEK